MRIINILYGINGVVSGGAATLDIPVGRRYHALKCFLSGTVAAAPSTNPVDIIQSARLLVNGIVMRDLTPAQILKIAALNNRPADATSGELPFFFSEPWRASVVGEESTSWDMTRQSRFTLELTFLPTVTAPACVVEAAFDYGQNVGADGKPFLAIVKQLRYTRSNPAGAVDITDLPQQYPIQRIHLETSAGNIPSLEVWNDTVKVMEGSKAVLDTFWEDYEMVPASGFGLSAVFDYSQQISDALFVANQNLNVRPVCGSAGSITAIVEHRAPGYV